MGKTKSARTGGGGNVDQFKSCDDVNIDGILSSQQPKALAFVNEEDVVSLVLVSAGGRDTVEVQVHHALLGTLVANSLDKLIRCMKVGHPFYGIITEKNGAMVKIWVRSGKPKP